MGDLARGDVIKHLRRERHLGQQAVADAVGVRLRTVQLWEASHGIKWPNAEALGSFLEIDPENLVERDGEDELDARLERIERSLALLEQGLAQLLTAITPQTEGVRDLRLEDALTPAPTQEAPQGTGGQGTNPRQAPRRKSA